MKLPELSRIAIVGACVLGCAALAAEPATPSASATVATPAASAPAGQASAGAARFAEVLATPGHLASLRKGGFVLYLRHGLTDNTRPDRVPLVDLNDCSTQRPLLEEGRKTSEMVGAALRRAGVPIGELRVSPLCRARESATAAFPAHTATVDGNLIYLANFTDAEKAPIIANTRQLLGQPVPPRTNRLLVAHAPNLMDLIGYFPKESTLVIFQPRPDAGFDYIASIPPAHWASLQKQ